MRHRTTDPACHHHRPIRGLFAGWRDRRARGRACTVCLRADIEASMRAAFRQFGPTLPIL